MIRKKIQLHLLVILVFIVGCDQMALTSDRSILADERFPTPIALTNSDIEWFRSFGVSWIFSENGSPALTLPGLTLEQQGILFGSYGSSKEAQLVLDKFERVFTTFAVYGRLNPGVYSIDSSKVIGEVPMGLKVNKKFELTQTHMDLIRVAFWRSGFIDYKYPYGNYGYYEADMAVWLGEDVPENSETGAFELSEASEIKYRKLHKELLLALLVFAKHAKIEPGEYQLPVDGWKNPFVRLSPPTKQQVDSYIINAIKLKAMPAKDLGGSAIDWIELNEEFSKVVN